MISIFVRLFFWTAVGLIAVAHSVSTALAADTYALDVQDKLNIRVVEWQTAEGAVRDWPAVTGTYVIGPAGTISLPFVGEMPASGKTTAQIAAAIGEQLQQKFGLTDLPEASVEIAEYRPFFMAGFVKSPGQYPYSPGMTVLRGLSIAGGTARDHGNQRISRDVIEAQSKLDIFNDQYVRLLVKRARIATESAGEQEIGPVPGIAENEKTAAILADEKSIMDSKREKLDRQTESLENLKTLLRQEITSLEKKSISFQRQIELARKELEGVGSLAKKGLVVNSKILQSERLIVDLEGKVLDLTTAILRAKQDISKADQDQIGLRNGMKADLAIERQQVDADINEVSRQLKTQQDLSIEALSIAPAAGVGFGIGEVAVAYTIVRKKDGKLAEIEAEEGTEVFPGDVVRVTIRDTPTQ